MARALVNIEHGDEDGEEYPVRDRQRHAEEGIEGVADAFTCRALQRAAELRLEDVHNEAVVATHVRGEGLGRHDFIVALLIVEIGVAIFRNSIRHRWVRVRWRRRWRRRLVPTP